MNALPQSLDRFESQLELAIGRQRRRRRTLVVRLAVAAAAAAALALGALAALPGEGVLPGAGGGSPVARAAVFLTPPDRAILHVVVVAEQTGPGGTTGWRGETWQQTEQPYDSRQVIVDGSDRREHALLDDTLFTYDERTNIVSAIPLARRARLFVQDGEGLRNNMLRLLRSGKAREEGRVTVVGREAVRIVSHAPDRTLLVDATTSEPIEWRSVEGGRVTTIRSRRTSGSRRPRRTGRCSASRASIPTPRSIGGACAREKSLRHPRPACLTVRLRREARGSSRSTDESCARARSLLAIARTASENETTRERWEAERHDR